MFHQLSPAARTALEVAASVASRMEAGAVQPAHLLYGLMSASGSHPATALHTCGVRAAGVLAWLQQQPAAAETRRGLSAPVEEVLATVAQLDRPADLTDLARGLLTSQATDVTHLLAAAGTTPQAVLMRLEQMQGVPHPAPGHHPASKATPVAPTPQPGQGAKVTGFYTDMLAEAKAGTLDAVVGRDRELDRVIRTLARRGKNNPVLVGDPGVGKTAVVEALAHRMASGRVPAALHGRQLWRVDVAALMAGARFRGDLEERVKELTRAASASAAILFVDELHMLMAGAGGEAAGLDVGNLLKEALGRGHVTVLGATTVTEYRTKISADAALERRFTSIDVAEPTPDETVAICTHVAPAYATHHQVTYTSDAIAACVRLATQHIRDRHNPDKSVDVLDEAGAQVALACSADPTREPVVDVAAVAAVVTQLSGVPVAVATADRRRALADLEQRLADRVVDQPAAVAEVARAVRRRRAGLTPAARPASFLFAGPTGVGKTELAKAVADVLFTDADDIRGRLVRFDMSEFADRHTVARLLGAPPGYVGHDAGGQLTEAVRRHPSSVVLLDEADKAHPEVFDALLAVLDDGRMTDGQGRTVDFRDTVVILATNTGADQVARTVAGFSGTHGVDAAPVVRAAVKAAFRPEFLNRLDDIVVFNPLTPAGLRTITRALVTDVVDHAATEGVQVSVSDAAVAAIVAAGTSAEYGARPLRRAVERLLLDPLTDLVLDTGTPRVHVHADADAHVVLTAPEAVPA